VNPHPNAVELEAFAAGEESERVKAHVDACDACRAFVVRARGVESRFDVGPVLAEARRSEKTRRFTLVATVGAPLALAAAAVLLVRSPQTPPSQSTTSPPADSAPLVLAQKEPDTTFKGQAQLAIVRDRAGAQERFVSAVRVRPGDRLRIEVALDRSQAILGGVMGDDGTWVELMPEAVRDAGTHFSEKSVRIDEREASGTMLVGTPADVRRARESKNTAGVRALRVEWERP
jgi:hypothetical protein